MIKCAANGVGVFLILFALAEVLLEVKGSIFRDEVTGVVVRTQKFDVGAEYDVDYEGVIKTYNGHREIGETITIDRKLVNP
jgi:hypothetical protein